MPRNGLHNSGVPLGGLGTGSVELRQDGLFHEWQLMNNRPWGTGPALEAPPDSAFFAIHIKGSLFGLAYQETVLLCQPPDYTSRFSLLGHFLNDPYHMPWMTHPEAIEAEVRFPFTRLLYQPPEDNLLPVSVDLEAFSPFIPLDAKNSGLPLAYFTFRLRNTSANGLQVSLLGALRNLTGYTYAEQLSTMTFQQGDQAAWIEYSRESLPADASDRGTLALGVIEEGPGNTSYLFHPRTSRDIWDPFHASGRLDNQDIGEFSGQVGNIGAERAARLRRGLPLGALCREVDLPAQAEKTITFVLAWHFPNLIEADYAEKKRMGQPIGHRYTEYFAGAADVLRYAAAQREDLRARTARFVDAYYRSSFPGWFLDAVAAQLSTLVKSSWWDRQGRFGIWEGLGCCGLQTTDITYYGSFPILQFFPDLQRSQMRLTRDNIETPGKIPHMMPANFSTADVDHRGRIDLVPQYILLVWRDALWTGDLAYAREMWPSVKDALAFFATLDTDGDGLPNNTGPDQTYDQFPLKGTSAFVGFLYAASLRAAAQLAELLGEPETAQDLEARLKKALRDLDRQLWTGAYYRLCYDLRSGEANEGVMADQINGDWFLRQSCGAGLLPNDRVRSALFAVLQYCGSNPMRKGYLSNCAWPFGGAIEIGRHTSDQANSPWSGVEYALAAHLILMGLERNAMQVVWDVWQRYERAGLRFNHIECGANYYRALSSWAVYLALTGFAWDAPRGVLAFTVRHKKNQYAFYTPTGWGEVVFDKQQKTCALSLRDGELTLNQLVIKGMRFQSVKAMVSGRHIGARVEPTASTAQLVFDAPLRLAAGETLSIGPA